MYSHIYTQLSDQRIKRKWDYTPLKGENTDWIVRWFCLFHFCLGVWFCCFGIFLENWSNSQEVLKPLSLDKALKNKPNRNFSE